MEDILSFLWYIIPGAIFLTPLAIIFEINTTPLVELLIFSSFPVGYMIHQLFRRITYNYYSNNRSLLKYLEDEMRDILGENGKNLKRRYVDYLYNYFFYSNRRFETIMGSIKKRSAYSISAAVCSSAFFLSFAFIILLKITAMLGYLHNNFLLQQEPLLALYFILYAVSGAFLYCWHRTLECDINNEEKFTVEAEQGIDKMAKTYKKLEKKGVWEKLETCRFYKDDC